MVAGLNLMVWVQIKKNKKLPNSVLLKSCFDAQEVVRHQVLFKSFKSAIKVLECFVSYVC